MAIKAGDVVRIKPEWQDPGDEKYVFRAVEDEDGGRVRIQCDHGWAVNPTQVVKVEWLEAN